MKNLTDTQIKNLAKFGLDILNITGTTEVVSVLLDSMTAIENTDANINRESALYTLRMLAAHFVKLELIAKRSGQTIDEYTGGDYEKYAY